MKRLRALFDQWGVYEGLKGYDLVLYAIELILLYPDYIHQLTTKLYPAIGQKFGCSQEAARKNIDYLIKCAWDSSPKELSQLSKKPLFAKPSVRDFLCMLCRYISQAEHGNASL